jgi:hypothetical protein
MRKFLDEGLIQMVGLFKLLLGSCLPRLLALTTLCIASSAFAGVSGVFCLFPADEDVSAVPEWTYPFVTGVAVRVKWATIEPAQGTYSWTLLDGAVAKAQSSGKKVAISVIAGCFSPNWVYNISHRILTLTGNDANAGNRMPAPWDQAYLTAWTACISKLGARYGGLPVVSYFTATGLGHTEECYVCANSTDAPQFDAPAWLGAAQKIVTAYTAALKGTPFVVAWGRPAPGQTQTASGCMYQVYTINSVVGFKADSLSSKFPNLGFLEGQLAKQMGQNGQPVVFQALKASKLGTALQQVISNGETMNMGAFEPYKVDVDTLSCQKVLANYVNP